MGLRWYSQLFSTCSRFSLFLFIDSILPVFTQKSEMLIQIVLYIRHDYSQQRQLRSSPKTSVRMRFVTKLKIRSSLIESERWTNFYTWRFAYISTSDFLVDKIGQNRLLRPYRLRQVVSPLATRSVLSAKTKKHGPSLNQYYNIE